MTRHGYRGWVKYDDHAAEVELLTSNYEEAMDEVGRLISIGAAWQTKAGKLEAQVERLTKALLDARLALVAVRPTIGLVGLIQHVNDAIATADAALAAEKVTP